MRLSPSVSATTISGHDVTLFSDAAQPDFPLLRLFAAGDIVWMVVAEDEALIEEAVAVLTADGHEVAADGVAPPAGSGRAFATLVRTMTSPPTTRERRRQADGQAGHPARKRRARPKPAEDFSPAGLQRAARSGRSRSCTHATRRPTSRRWPPRSPSRVEAHGDQKRVSGEPYISHPLAVAKILAELGLDPVAVTAALLHDVPEDTELLAGRCRGTLRYRRGPPRRWRHQAGQVQHPEP